MKSSISILLTSLLLSSSMAYAEEEPVIVEEEKSPFQVSIEFGALLKTGDTESGDIKAGLDVDYEKGRWKSLFRSDLLVRKLEEEDENGKDHYETSDQKWSINSQTNYALEEEGENYVFLSLAYEDDRFSSFDNQSSISSGWGRQWYKTDKASLYADIGPGFKRDEIKGTETEKAETKTSAIAQAQVLYKRQLNEHVEFKQYLVAKYALENDENSVYQAETSITTKLIETLQLKFTYRIDHNTEVDEGKENTNTQTSMTLVYSF